MTSFLDDEVQRVVEIIKEVGVGRLGKFDGCICCHFKVRDVDVFVSCGKGNDRGVLIDSGSLDYYDTASKGLDKSALQPVLEEVLRQLDGVDERGPINGAVGSRKEAA